MNCKPGQLARIVRTGPFYGYVIRVTEVFDEGYGPTWFYEGERFPIVIEGEQHWQDAFFDRVLKPICDPGEDAQDETLSWKPVPLPVVDPSLLEKV